MSPAFVITLTFTLLCVVHCSPNEKKKEDGQDFKHPHHLELSEISSNYDIPSFKHNSFEEDQFSVSALIEKANWNIAQKPVNTGFKNADPCTSSGCMWKKASNGKVYVPYYINNDYTSSQRKGIEEALESFTKSTCIRFKPRTCENDYLYIKSDAECTSYVGRRGGSQVLSLNRKSCLSVKAIHHSLMLALGFDHEQERSDRDQYVRILFENIMPGKEHNFQKINTNNLGTTYNYNSVMHYGRYTFSKNGRPTIIPIPDQNIEIGKAEMITCSDIMRVNKLYSCE